MCVHMFAGELAYTDVSEDTFSHFFLYLKFWRPGLLLSLKIIIWLDSLTSEPPRISCLWFPQTRVIGIHWCAQLLCKSWRSKLRPPYLKGSTLPTESIPQPPQVLCLDHSLSLFLDTNQIVLIMTFFIWRAKIFLAQPE